jgi:hypothetical protein
MPKSRLWIVLSENMKCADEPHAILLRVYRERPRGRAAEQRDDFAASDESCHLMPPAGKVTAQR